MKTHSENVMHVREVFHLDCYIHAGCVLSWNEGSLSSWSDLTLASENGQTSN